MRTPESVVVVGLTGGIASGKSTVCELLKSEAGAVVLNADLFGHEAYKPGTECLEKLVEHFGSRILNEEDGSVDRTKLGPIVFSDPAQLQALNAIVWPAIKQLLKDAIAEAVDEFDKGNAGERGFTPVIVVEAAVLLEASWEDLVDEIWVVTCPPAVAKERLMARNNLTAEQAMTRISSQMSNEERGEAAHVVISNSTDEAGLKVGVLDQIEAFNFRYSKQSAFEFVDVVDANDQVQYHAKRAVVRTFNLIHRCSYGIVLNSESGQVYVQTRSKHKDAGPGLLDPAPGGVVGSGESYEANIKREMAEEMGLTSLQFRPLCAMYFEHDIDGRSWGTIFLAETNVPVEELTLQESEVDFVELMSTEEICALDAENFLPGGLAAFKKYIEHTSK